MLNTEARLQLLKNHTTNCRCTLSQQNCDWSVSTKVGKSHRLLERFQLWLVVLDTTKQVRGNWAELGLPGSQVVILHVIDIVCHECFLICYRQHEHHTTICHKAMLVIQRLLQHLVLWEMSLLLIRLFDLSTFSLYKYCIILCHIKSRQHRCIYNRSGIQSAQMCIVALLKEKKRKSEYLYSALEPKLSSQSAQAWITQFYLQITPCLLFLRKHSPDGATHNWGSIHPIAAYYSFIDLNLVVPRVNNDRFGRRAKPMKQAITAHSESVC